MALSLPTIHRITCQPAMCRQWYPTDILSSSDRPISSADQEVLIIPMKSHYQMKTIMILASLLAAITLAAAYTPEQQTTVDGVRLSFQLGQAYEKAIQGQNIPAYNSLVDQWNAWVVKNFGEDTALLMAKINAPVNLQKPYLASNDTTSKGIAHEMDGGSQYATNDANLLPDSAIARYAASEQGKATGSDFLGGV